MIEHLVSLDSLLPEARSLFKRPSGFDKEARNSLLALTHDPEALQELRDAIKNLGLDESNGWQLGVTKANSAPATTFVRIRSLDGDVVGVLSIRAQDAAKAVALKLLSAVALTLVSQGAASAIIWSSFRSVATGFDLLKGSEDASLIDALLCLEAAVVKSGSQWVHLDEIRNAQDGLTESPMIALANIDRPSVLLGALNQLAGRRLVETNEDSGEWRVRL